MPYNDYMQTFEVRNKDINIKFSCPLHGKRIRECINNLQIDINDNESLIKMQALYTSCDTNVEFRFGTMNKDNESEGWSYNVIDRKEEALFFENTDYPVHILPRHNGIVLQKLVIGKEENIHVAAEEEIIFGTINFRNQVGRTDIKVIYSTNGEDKVLSFSSEVLSYKMDYRTDMKQVIQDIEEEFSMLSYSLLKETYLTFKQANKDSSNLIWWQIFHECYKRIVESADYIINRPKRRLKSDIRYERAERLTRINPELENEYSEFEREPNHLYRVEEMLLSKDTVENRFLKYVLQNIKDRFKRVKNNVLSILNADNIHMHKKIEVMNDELDRLNNSPFFRGIGKFKGFTQDSLVMKQVHGYKEIYEYWIILQCGYELQEGIMHLQVKEISELYEIWCFIKIKNMVQHILRDKVKVSGGNRQTKGDFIKSLVQGKSSDVCFTDKNTEIVLASVMYNATTDNEDINDFDPSKQTTDIIDTTSKTTEQRPDIVLRLSKSKDDIQYTYLFDAKYRLNDRRIFDLDVPPVDAINQMHRYRDAIYYTKSEDNKLKREVIGGYVLYPGNLNSEDIKKSYYYKSIKDVNIGAYPLKPGGYWHAVNAELLLDPHSAEDILYQQIANWLNEEDPKARLLETSIPQNGLEYSDEPVVKGCYFLSTIDLHVNRDILAIKNGKATEFISGYATILAGLDLQKIKYFAPVINHIVSGYYHVISVKVVDMKDHLQKDYNNYGRKNTQYKGYDKPIRVKFKLCNYKELNYSFTYGLDYNAAKGVSLSKAEFMNYIKKARNNIYNK